MAGGPAPGTTGTGAETTFIEGVAAGTGIDPRVLQAQADVEGATAPGGTGHFNYLNLKPYPGDPYSGVSPGGFEQFASVQDAIAATVRRLHQPFAAGIIASTQGASATPQKEIAAIAASGWDAGHYGGVGGPSLLSEFTKLYGGQSAQTPATSQGTGESPLSNAPIVSGPAGAASAVGSALSYPAKIWAFVTSWRFVEIVGGFFLLLVGLYLLGRQFGIQAPTPPVVKAAGGLADGTFQAPPGAGSDAHYASNRAYTGRGGARQESVPSGPQPVYSGRQRPASAEAQAMGDIPF